MEERSMIVNGNIYRNVRGLSTSDESTVIQHLQQEARQFPRGQWFCARDIVGGDNGDWSLTPMYPVYANRHKQHGPGPYAEDIAGKDAGKLLRKALVLSKFKYEIDIKSRVRRYRMI
jgi:hypothetical protein